MEKVCAGPECYDTKIHGRGYCAAHYRQKFVLGGELRPKKKIQRNLICSLDFCDKKAIAKGFCSSHWAQVKRYKIEPRPINEFTNKVCAYRYCGKSFGTRMEASALCKQCRSRCRMYGITEIQYLSMPIYCEACGSDKRISVDHNHETGEYRGVLCGTCNTALGMVHENVEKLEGIINYIKVKRNG